MLADYNVQIMFKRQGIISSSIVNLSAVAAIFFVVKIEKATSVRGKCS